MPMPMTTNGQFQNSRQEIIKVNGENGARAFQMMPNSSALLLDENNPIIWLVQTDGAGYKTVSPYSITPYQPAPAIDLNDIDARLKRVEEKINESDNKSASIKPVSNQTDMAEYTIVRKPSGISE